MTLLLKLVFSSVVWHICVYIFHLWPCSWAWTLIPHGMLLTPVGKLTSTHAKSAKETKKHYVAVCEKRKKDLIAHNHDHRTIYFGLKTKILFPVAVGYCFSCTVSTHLAILCIHGFSCFLIFLPIYLFFIPFIFHCIAMTLPSLVKPLQLCSWFHHSYFFGVHLLPQLLCFFWLISIASSEIGMCYVWFCVHIYSNTHAHSNTDHRCCNPNMSVSDNSESWPGITSRIRFSHPVLHVEIFSK